MPKNDLPKLLKIKEAAQMLSVNPETLRRWDGIKGKPQPIIISTRGDRRYKKEDIERFILDNKNKK